MAVDVVIVTYESAADVGPAITSARRSPDVARIVVVDNASTDGSAAAAQAAAADLVVRNETNVGFARGVNRGLAECDAELVLLLNPDAELPEGCLAALVADLAAHPDAVIVGPLLREPDGRLLTGARRFSHPWLRVAEEMPLLRRRRPAARREEYGTLAADVRGGRTATVDYVWGACALARRDFLNLVGGLDERFFMYGEDEDLGREACRRGRRVLVDLEHEVRHVSGASSRAARPGLAGGRQAAAMYALFGKWHGRLAAEGFRWGLGVAYLLQGLAAVARGHPREAAAVRCVLEHLRRAGDDD